MLSKNYKGNNKKYILFLVIFFLPFIFKSKFDHFKQDIKDIFEIPTYICFFMNEF